MRTARKTLVSVAALLLVGVGAQAGEITGNGKSLKNENGTLNGRSACAFSGQQDDPIADEGVFRGDRVQNWGQIPKAVRDFLRTIGLHPGDSCNPRKSSGQEP